MYTVGLIMQCKSFFWVGFYIGNGGKILIDILTMLNIVLAAFLFKT